MCKVMEQNELNRPGYLQEEETIYISKHAFQRMKERQGWSKSTAARMIKKVFDSGIASDRINGYRSLWIKLKDNYHSKSDHTYILYGDYIYIFIKSILVTVEHIPPKLSILRAKNHSKKFPGFRGTCASHP